MGWFKRLCLFVFGLAGILALAALLLPWIGPYTHEATQLLTTNLTYWYVVLGAAGITGLGALICFLRSIFSPRNRKVVTVSKVDGGEITVTRSAIASQAKHIVESDGTCVAANTRVRAGKRSVRVHLRVTPKHALNVVSKGEELHNELVEGLRGVCGDTLKDVSLVFTDPQSFEEPKPDYLSTTYADYNPAGNDTEEAQSYAPADGGDNVSAVPESTEYGPVDGITVPLHGGARHDEELDAGLDAVELPGTTGVDATQASEDDSATEVAPLAQTVPEDPQTSESPAVDQADRPALDSGLGASAAGSADGEDEAPAEDGNSETGNASEAGEDQ